MRVTFSEVSNTTPDVIPASPCYLVKRTTNRYDINDLLSIHHHPEIAYPLVTNEFMNYTMHHLYIAYKVAQ